MEAPWRKPGAFSGVDGVRAEEAPGFRHGASLDREPTLDCAAFFLTTLARVRTLAGMPVYHFTYHGYRTWNADREEGWHQHGEEGVHPPQPELATHRDSIADGDMMEFSVDRRRVLFEILTEVCCNHGWRLHCVGIDDTHLHPVVSWEGEVESGYVKDRLKNLLSLLLNRREERVGRHVFSKKSGDTRVYGRRHLTYLKTEYLPKHAFFWCEEE